MEQSQNPMVLTDANKSEMATMINKLLKDNATLKVENFELKSKLAEYQKKNEFLEDQLKDRKKISSIQIIDKSSIMNPLTKIVNPTQSNSSITLKNKDYSHSQSYGNNSSTNSVMIPNKFHTIRVYDPSNVAEEKSSLLVIRPKHSKTSIQLQADPKKIEQLNTVLIMPTKPQIIQSLNQENMKVGRPKKNSVAVWDSNNKLKQSIKLNKSLK